MKFFRLLIAFFSIIAHSKNLSMEGQSYDQGCLIINESNKECIKKLEELVSKVKAACSRSSQNSHHTDFIFAQEYSEAIQELAFFSFSKIQATPDIYPKKFKNAYLFSQKKLISLVLAQTNGKKERATLAYSKAMQIIQNTIRLINSWDSLHGIIKNHISFFNAKAAQFGISPIKLQANSTTMKIVQALEDQEDLYEGSGLTAHESVLLNRLKTLKKNCKNIGNDSWQKGHKNAPLARSYIDHLQILKEFALQELIVRIESNPDIELLARLQNAYVFSQLRLISVFSANKEHDTAKKIVQETIDKILLWKSLNLQYVQTNFVKRLNKKATLFKITPIQDFALRKAIENRVREADSIDTSMHDDAYVIDLTQDSAYDIIPLTDTEYNYNDQEMSERDPRMKLDNLLNPEQEDILHDEDVDAMPLYGIQSQIIVCNNSSIIPTQNQDDRMKIDSLLN